MILLSSPLCHPDCPPPPTDWILLFCQGYTVAALVAIFALFLWVMAAPIKEGPTQ